MSGDQDPIKDSNPAEWISRDKELLKDLEMYRDLVVADGKEYLLEAIQLMEDSEELREKVEGMDADGDQHFEPDEITRLVDALEELKTYDDGVRQRYILQTIHDLDGYSQTREKIEDRHTLCLKHRMRQAHTGGNIFVCPECELEEHEDNPEYYSEYDGEMLAEYVDRDIEDVEERVEAVKEKAKSENDKESNSQE